MNQMRERVDQRGDISMVDFEFGGEMEEYWNGFFNKQISNYFRRGGATT